MLQVICEGKAKNTYFLQICLHLTHFTRPSPQTFSDTQSKKGINGIFSIANLGVLRRNKHLFFSAKFTDIGSKLICGQVCRKQCFFKFPYNSRIKAETVLIPTLDVLTVLPDPWYHLQGVCSLYLYRG